MILLTKHRGGGDIIGRKSVVPVCAFGFTSNLVLFIVKLYVGLSCNSISIYSDGINNMFDGLSALLTAICLGFLGGRLLMGTAATVKRAETLLSLVLGLLVFLSGGYFAYTSLERLIYPTPVWFSMKYLYILGATALFKLVMLFVYRAANRKIGSQVVRIMSLDCMLDFFITAVTIVSLWASAKGGFSLDALCGLAISAVVIISSLRTLAGHLKAAVGYVPAEQREEIGTVFEQAGISPDGVDVFFEYGDVITGYISFESPEEREKAELLYNKIKEETDIVLKTVEKEKEINENG